MNFSMLIISPLAISLERARCTDIFQYQCCKQAFLHKVAHFAGSMSPNPSIYCNIEECQFSGVETELRR